MPTAPTSRARARIGATDEPRRPDAVAPAEPIGQAGERAPGPASGRGGRGGAGRG